MINFVSYHVEIFMSRGKTDWLSLRFIVKFACVEFEGSESVQFYWEGVRVNILLLLRMHCYFLPRLLSPSIVSSNFHFHSIVPSRAGRQIRRYICSQVKWIEGVGRKEEDKEDGARTLHVVGLSLLPPPFPLSSLSLCLYKFPVIWNSLLKLTSFLGITFYCVVLYQVNLIFEKNSGHVFRFFLVLSERVDWFKIHFLSGSECFLM